MVEGSVVIGDVTITYERLAILALAVAIVGLLAAYIRFTATGKAIRATRSIPRRRRRSASISTASTRSHSASAPRSPAPRARS